MPGENAAPMHPYCRCSVAAWDDSDDYEAWLDFLDKGGTTEEWEKLKTKIPLNLQFFSQKDKNQILNRIADGEIDSKVFENNYNYFKKSMEKGVLTPIGTVYDESDCYYHIINHHLDMMKISNTDRIINTLKNPNAIYSTKDRFGNEGIGYVEDNENNTLLVIVRNGIITSYEPKSNYLSKIKGCEVLWKKD